MLDWFQSLRAAVHHPACTVVLQGGRCMHCPWIVLLSLRALQSALGHNK